MIQAPTEKTVETSQPKQRIFFPNLDGLRFFSFFAVFLYHCLISIVSYLPDTSPAFYNGFEFLFQYGFLGVNFFFVLSGFLITYLLIKEKEFTGRIHVGNFYVRRILRIWPLYFLCVFIGFAVFAILKKMEGQPVMENANPWYYVFFAANFDIMHTWPEKPNALLLSVLWSVAVEEQFYLTWPLILGFFRIKNFKFIFPVIMLGSLVFRAFYTADTDADHAVRYFHTFSLIGDMALGGLFAYFVSYESRFKKWIINLSKGSILLLYAATLLVCLFKSVIFTCGVPVIFERIVIGALFGMIILEQNYAHNSPLKLKELKRVSSLGIYTYGLYCLHFLGIYFTLKIISKLGLNASNVWVALLSCAMALVLTIVIGLASYHLFEKWFLRLKDRFAVIVKK